MSPGRALLLLAAGTLAGCGAGGVDPDAAGDGRPADARGPDAAPCAEPAACDWVEDYLREVVGKLSGERPIADGVRLAARATAEERASARDYLWQELARLGYTVSLHDYGTGANVVGVLPAPGEAIVIAGAHFDGVPFVPAAADDATGCALVLAAARWLPEATGRTRPIHVVLFDEEELGLIGSHRYAEMLFTAGTEVAGVHVYDMISFDGDGDRAVELWSPSPALEAAYRAHGEVLGMPIQPVSFTSSDHQSFLERGFPATGVSEEFVAGDHTPHYHQPTDTYDHVDFAYLTAVTRLAMAVLRDAITAE
jgi:hypothetical protein